MLVSRPLSVNARATASCASTDSVGDFVCVSGPLSGGDISVIKADVAHANRMPSVAVIIAKLSSVRCVVQMAGDLEGLYSGLAPGRVYFVGSDARPSVTPPAPGSGGRAYVQAIGVAIDPAVLRLDPGKDMLVRVG